MMKRTIRRYVRTSYFAPYASYFGDHSAAKSDLLGAGRAIVNHRKLSGASLVVSAGAQHGRLRIARLRGLHCAFVSFRIR